MAQKVKTQKTFDFKELFYVLRKNWLVEAILFVVILALGVVYTRVNTDFYVANATVVLKAEIGSSSSSYNDTVLSKMYLETKKLAYSRMLLKEGMPVADACSLAGFSDYSNFIRLFRLRFGITPNKYKKK